MSYITVPATYMDGIVTPLEKIKNNPTKVMVTFEYQELGDKTNYRAAMKDYNKGDKIFNMKDMDSLMKDRGIIK